MFGIPNGMYVWGKQYHDKAKAELVGQPIQPSSYNANYIKPIGGSSVPIPIHGEQPLPIYGSDIFNGVAVAGYINRSYSPSSYNANYLKPTVFRKTPIPEPYSLSKALALANAQATPDDSQVEEKPVDLLTTVKNLFEAASDPAEKAIWQQHMNGLQRLNAISQFRALTSEENQRLQKIKSDIEKQAAQLTPPPAPQAPPPPTAAEIAQQIAAVLPANPTAAEIASAIASVLPGSTPSTILAPTVVLGRNQPQPSGLADLTQDELGEIEKGQSHRLRPYFAINP